MTNSLIEPGYNRRAVLAGCLAGAAASLISAPARAQAQAWPSKPIRLVLGYAPGGSVDIIARELAGPLGRLLGQPIIVDYKSGAAGAVASAEVARAAPDGYTLALIDNGPLTIVPAVRKLAYDPVTGFTPIGFLLQTPQVLIASPTLAVGNVRDLIAAMRAAPGSLSFGTGGVGSISQMCGELLKAKTQTFAVHIPYRGGAPAVTAVAAGEVQFAFLTYAATSGFIKSGRVKALGVSSRTRLPMLPDVATVAEQGLPDFEANSWLALMGPAGLPPPVLAALQKALAVVLALPETVTRFEAQGSMSVASDMPLRQRIGDELALWRKLIAEQKLVIEG